MNGIFERATRHAVRLFQEAHDLPVDGQIGTDTWAKLLDCTPVKVEWGADDSVAASLRGGRRAAGPQFSSAWVDRGSRGALASLCGRGVDAPWNCSGSLALPR